MKGPPSELLWPMLDGFRSIVLACRFAHPSISALKEAIWYRYSEVQSIYPSIRLYHHFHQPWNAWWAIVFYLRQNCYLNRTRNGFTFLVMPGLDKEVYCYDKGSGLLICVRSGGIRVQDEERNTYFPIHAVCTLPKVFFRFQLSILLALYLGTDCIQASFILQNQPEKTNQYITTDSSINLNVVLWQSVKKFYPGDLHITEISFLILQYI